jgi:hypothetical protein
MSSLLGVIDVSAIIIAVYFTYLNNGVASDRISASCILALVFAIVGLILGYMGKNEAGKFYLFTYIGIILNVLAIISIGLLLSAGAYL